MRREDRERHVDDTVGRGSESEKSGPERTSDSRTEQVKGGPTSSGSRTTPSSEQPRGRMPLPD